MTDKPAESAVERYERLKVTESWPSDDSTLGRADATIAELKAENEALRREVEGLKVCGNCGHCPDQAAAVAYVHPETGHGSATGANQPNYEMTAYVVDWKQRAEVAEAEVERLKIDSRSYWKLVAKKAEADVDGCNGALVEAEAERDRLRWMLIRNVCDECLVHTSGACSEEEDEDCPPVRDALADLAARYDARHEGGDG